MPLSAPGRIEGSLLGLILDHHPAQVSVDELVRLMNRGPADFGARDDVLVALDDLIGHGLAHRHGEFVFASVAAVRFNDLGSSSVLG